MKAQGFTLVELLVSISIFTIITTVAVFNHTQFNGSVLLTNHAYEIALSIRQAQFYGITVKKSATADTFTNGYGVHFDTSSPADYVLFEDRIADHVYSSAGSEGLEAFHIPRGNTISKLCVEGDCGNTVVDVSFIRPNPDTYITAGSQPTPLKSNLDICLTSPQGMHRIVAVESTGQISVRSDDDNICED